SAGLMAPMPPRISKSRERNLEDAATRQASVERIRKVGTERVIACPAARRKLSHISVYHGDTEAIANVNERHGHFLLVSLEDYRCWAGIAAVTTAPTTQIPKLQRILKPGRDHSRKASF